MKILMATDGSDHSEEAARKCCDLIANARNPKIRIISVAEYTSPVVAEQIVLTNELFQHVAGESKRIAEESVLNLKEMIEEQLGSEVKYELETAVVSGSAREAIVREAEEWGADLIVVGSHGYGFWDRMLLGSVSDAVIHHAPCSVLVVRTKEDAN